MNFMHKQLLIFGIINCFLINSLHADKELADLPEPVITQWQQATKIGQARFSRFGIHIYDASFWSLSNQNSSGDAIHATALSIQYARNIKAEKLLSSTHKQWKRLGFADNYPLQAWLYELDRLWPDVRDGDQLIFVSRKNGHNSFYSKNKKLGSIDDAQFNKAFLDIWLSPQAKYQKHRKELLGED